MTATEPVQATTGVPFTLNGNSLEAKQGELLIDAAARHGVHIPHFCYHPRMKPVGMCRMCLVEVDTGRGPGLQPSCMLPVTPEMKVNTETEPTTRAQDGVLELLLINHPLDCPVCDKGGECPLQDNAYAFGPGESRFVEEKRHYEKPIPISDLVYLDRERCILCDRCTRFASDVAGDPLIHFIGRGAQTEVNTFPEHEFSSYFSGNTVQICPVGALTAQPYRFAARPWDLTDTESTSATDSSGARVVLQSSQDRLVRILGVDSDAVNWSWLSDKERFSYEATDSAKRLTEPRLRVGGGGTTGGLKVTRWNTAVDKAVEALATASDPSRIGVLGGARLTLEAQYAWAKLLKGLGGIDNVDAQLADGLPADVVLGMPRATIPDAFQPGGVVVLLAPDLKEELPTLYLRLRHALENDGVSLIELTPQASSLSHYASARLHALSGTTGQVASAVADGMVGTSVSGVEPADLSAAAELLKSGRHVTVIVGRANLAEGSQHVVSAMAAIQRIAPETQFLSALRRSNIHGALEMGLTPGFLPGGQKVGTAVEGWPMASTTPGMDATAIVDAAANGKIDTLLLLGADPVKDFPDRDRIAEAMERVGTIIAVDTFETASVELADVILPATMFGEVDGTFMNLEGRISPLVSKVTGPGQTRHDWIIAIDLAVAAGGDLGFGSLDEIRTEISSVVPGFEAVEWDVAGVQSDGPVIRTTRSWQPDIRPSVPVAQSDDYGLRLIIDRKLWDLGTLVQNSSSLDHLAEPAVMAVNSADATRLGIAHGDTVPMTGGGVTMDATISVQPGIPEGAARISHALPGLDPGVFVRSGQQVTELRPAAPARSPEPEAD